MTIEHDASWRPTLCRHAQLRAASGARPDLLVLPERVIRLSPSAGAILARCTGSLTIGQMVADLEAQFHRGDLTGDVTDFVSRAVGLGWVR